ncbi:hypothetical protein Hanom_Chr06g00522841 [Helianthus anomalus]
MTTRSEGHPIQTHSHARATHWHVNPNIYCILDENYPNIESFKEIIPFLKESRIAKALTEKKKCYESHVRMFWKSVRYDEQEKTIYLAVRMKDENDKDIDVEVKFTMADVRRVLDLKDSDDDPIIIPERLSKGFWFRMGYAGHVNDKGYIKSKFCRPYKFMVHYVMHALSHRKGAYDETSGYIMKIITCLVLNRPYNISQVLLNHMVDNVKEGWEKEKDTKDFSPTVTTLKVVIKGKIGKQESSERFLHTSFKYYSNSVDVCIAEPIKKKSPPRLIDETVISPADLIKGVEYLNLSFDDYIKQTEAAAKAQGAKAAKEAETSAKNVEAESIKEKEVEGIVESNSSATESDVDPTTIAPTSYISRKQKFKGVPKKKKDSDEEDSTYEPTPQEKKKKVIRKRKAQHTGAVLRSVRAKRIFVAKQQTTTIPEVQSIQMPEVESVKVPEVETTKGPEVEKVQTVNDEVQNVEKVVEDVEVEYMEERQSTPPPPPINPTIHIPDDPKEPSQPKKDTFSSSFDGFLKVQGEYTDDLPEGDYDMFNDGKINVLTKKVSMLEKGKAKAEAELKAVKAENVELEKAVNDHADRIDQLTDDYEEQAKVIDRITEEFDEVIEKYKTMNATNSTLYQMIGELHETSSNESKVLRQEIKALRADKVVKDEQLNMVKKELAEEVTQKKKGLVVDTEEILGSSSQQDTSEAEGTISSNPLAMIVVGDVIDVTPEEIKLNRRKIIEKRREEEEEKLKDEELEQLFDDIDNYDPDNDVMEMMIKGQHGY